MEFNLHHLRMFLIVAKYENYSRAAAELFISQPALSAQIASLEKNLGFSLFTRYGRGVILTPEGQVLYEQVRVFLEKYDTINQVVTDIKAMKVGSVHLAATTTAGIYIVPALLGEYHRRYPNIELFLEINNRHQVERQLLNNQADLAVMGIVEHPDELCIEPFLPNELVVVASPAYHLLKEQRQYKLNELTKEPLLIRESGSGTRLDVENVLKELGVEFKTLVELGSIEAIKRGVAVEMGITVLPKQAIEIEVAAGTLKALQVEGFPIRRRWSIAYREGRKLSLAATVLKDYLLDWGRIFNSTLN
ncbi:LysR substrate-binding domain-containing protein [Candidatus Chlorohelix sp.]|uniref:LysR substrate-binding domain-containing protein n=1 Tax=Candidatus Chlorohelix sp. TaxID=3139201 RepID=UPI00305D0E7E